MSRNLKATILFCATLLWIPFTNFWVMVGELTPLKVCLFAVYTGSLVFGAWEVSK